MREGIKSEGLIAEILEANRISSPQSHEEVH
jgi:hypothetical protein